MSGFWKAFDGLGLIPPHLHRTTPTLIGGTEKFWRPSKGACLRRAGPSLGWSNSHQKMRLGPGIGFPFGSGCRRPVDGEPATSALSRYQSVLQHQRVYGTIFQVFDWKCQNGPRRHVTVPRRNDLKGMAVADTQVCYQKWGRPELKALSCGDRWAGGGAALEGSTWCRWSLQYSWVTIRSGPIVLKE